jgi:hypothetical protein
MAKYNPQVLETFASKLYQRANSIIAVSIMLGGAAGSVGGWLLEQNVRTSIPEGVIIAACAAFLGVVGFVLGSAKAFMLKVQAQLALCQLQIEVNTRRSDRAAQ